MKSQWQKEREQRDRDQALIVLISAVIVVAIAFMVYQVVVRPLPDHLSDLVVSPGALARLHREATNGP